MSYKCPLCGEQIEDPEVELCPSCHRAFNDEFAPNSIFEFDDESVHPYYGLDTDCNDKCYSDADPGL